MSESDIYVARHGGPRTRLQRLHDYRLLWWLTLGVFISDRLSKWWVVEHLPYYPYHNHDGSFGITLIDGFLYFTHARNTGAAWSILSGHGTLLGIFAILTLIAIYRWRHSLGLRARGMQLGFGLLCGGIAGNLVDRLVHNYVIDFIDVHFGSYIYPTFNIADSGICVGVIIYLWHTFKAPTKP